MALAAMAAAARTCMMHLAVAGALQQAARGRVCIAADSLAFCAVTNHDMRVPVVYLQDEIYSSSYAAAAYLESIDFKKKV
jgi:hypothetical protein